LAFPLAKNATACPIVLLYIKAPPNGKYSIKDVSDASDAHLCGELNNRDNNKQALKALAQRGGFKVQARDTTTKHVLCHRFVPLCQVITLELS
jgi:hypothetical protein